jgi:hypothetical protein
MYFRSNSLRTGDDDERYSLINVPRAEGIASVLSRLFFMFEKLRNDACVLSFQLSIFNYQLTHEYRIHIKEPKLAAEAYSTLF